MLSTVKLGVTTLMSSDCRATYTLFGDSKVRNVLKDFCFEGNISDVDVVTKVFACLQLNSFNMYRLFIVEAIKNLLLMFFF